MTGQKGLRERLCHRSAVSPYYLWDKTQVPSYCVAKNRGTPSVMFLFNSKSPNMFDGVPRVFFAKGLGGSLGTRFRANRTAT